MNKLFKYIFKKKLNNIEKYILKKKRYRKMNI